MDPISVTGLVIAVVQLAAACLKSSRTFVGPSQHSHKYLHDIISDLYSFNAAIKNLETHLQICEEDQGRLNSLSDLKEPLETSKTSLELIENYIKDPKFMRKHVLGVRFDEKLKGCMRSLKMSRILFEEVLQMDQRSVSSFSDTNVSRT